MESPKYCLEYLSESWSQFGKILGVRLIGMQSKVGSLSRGWNCTMELHKEVKENQIKAEYPYLFYHHLPNLEDEIHLKGGRIVTP